MFGFFAFIKHPPSYLYVADCILVEETTELWPEVVTRSLLEYI